MGFSIEFWAGIIGAVVGGLITLSGQFLLHEWTTRRERKLDKERKALLYEMLKNPEYEWREMETLSGVIGASREETARLLIELKARSSETRRDIWAFIKEKPLP